MQSRSDSTPLDTGNRAPTQDPAFDLGDAKFQPPAGRRGIVRRPALVARLDATQADVVSVVAPPGYGKTTLLAEWAAQLAIPVAWVSCDDGDNDPVALLNAIAAALNRIEPVDPPVFSALAAAGAGITFVARFISMVAHRRRPVAVVLDHVEAVTSKDCRAMISEFAVRLPPGWRLAVASRTEPPLPTARLRVQGRSIEIGANELAMGTGEAQALLDGAGVTPDAAKTSELVDLTEGWPAGLYLAALAMRAGASERDVRSRFTGDDRFVRDYLHFEMLDQVSHDETSFLMRTSILDRMCGPLCDALLEREGSRVMLDELEGRNLFVVPLDRRREWYRYHHLFRELLQTELLRREPDFVRGLHSRAARWYETHGMPEAAIDHALSADDDDQAVRLVLAVQQPVWASGRVETVLHWMERVRDKTSAHYYGAIAVHGSLIFALLGNAAEAEQWAEAAERAPDPGVLPDGSTMAGTLAYLRSNMFRAGVAEMRRDAELAREGLSPSSPYRATMLHTEGLSYLLEDDPDRADPIFARAFDAAISSGALPLAALVLAERCVVAAARDDWPYVVMLAKRAMQIVHEGGFEDYWTSSLVFAWAARSAARRSDIASARRYLTQATRLRPLLTHALPAVSVQALLELARAYIALADPGGAAAVLEQAGDILAQRPDLGTLVTDARDLRGTVATINQEAIGASALTPAELRVLPLLATHLSLPEIAEQLTVSFHTVKSHAHSIYQKLGVSSRSQAVTRSHELGLADL